MTALGRPADEAQCARAAVTDGKVLGGALTPSLDLVARCSAGSRAISQLRRVVRPAADVGGEAVVVLDVDRRGVREPVADREPADRDVDPDHRTGRLRRRPRVEPRADDLRRRRPAAPSRITNRLASGLAASGAPSSSIVP